MNCNLICKFYNKISGNNVENIEQIPSEILEFILLMDVDDLKKPFARRELLRGVSTGRVSVLVQKHKQWVWRLM